MKITVAISCQIQECAFEVSYPLDMMKMYNAMPICEPCYDVLADTRTRWAELPDISLEDLDFGVQSKTIRDLTTGDEDQ